MQTFLPVADFAESARILDYKRLGKQRVETMQIFNAMQNPDAAWANHPMSAMWRDYPNALLWYGKIMCTEWERRGYKSGKMTPWFDNALPKLTNGQPIPLSYVRMPLWLGHERLHSSHRAALLWKHLSYYQRFGWEETPEYNYYWPV